MREIERRLRQIAYEVAEFAKSEALMSGLPGSTNGPADAYRHLVGVGELARRIGVAPASVISELNEILSGREMRRAEIAGEPVPPANTSMARAMDRANNRLGAGLGMTASTPEDVVRRARLAIERAQALHGGSGAMGTAFWHPRADWADDGQAIIAWPPPRWTWPDVESPHLRAYRQAAGIRLEPERPSTTYVDPHMRDGHPVSGHWRRVPRPQ